VASISFGPNAALKRVGPRRELCSELGSDFRILIRLSIYEPIAQFMTRYNVVSNSLLELRIPVRPKSAPGTFTRDDLRRRFRRASDSEFRSCAPGGGKNQNGAPTPCSRGVEPVAWIVPCLIRLPNFKVTRTIHDTVQRRVQQLVGSVICR